MEGRLQSKGLFLLLLVCLTGCAERGRPTQRPKLSSNDGATLAEQPREPESSRMHRMRIGFCEDYPEESRTIAGAQRDLRLLRENGIRVLRIAFGWDAIEEEPGKYDWQFWDEYVRMAGAEGITLIPYVCYTPGWASSAPGPDAWRNPPRDPELFANFMRLIVSRYGDQIGSWEIWNEPDNPHYWLGSVEQFGELLREGSLAVRKTDPRDKVVLGGLAWNLAFLDALATNSILTNVDVVNLHNYYETWSDEPLEQLPEYVGRARQIIARNGLDLPIWMAELGYSSQRSNSFVSAQFMAAHDFEHTDEYQASALFRMLTLLMDTESVDLAAWYRIHDLPGTQEVIGDKNNRSLGVLTEEGRAKPALRALTFFDRLFREGVRTGVPVKGGSNVKITTAAGSKAEVHVFEKAAGQTVVVAWLKTVTHKDRFMTGGERRPETVEVQFGSRGKPVRLFDELGNRRKLGRAESSEGNLKVSLPLEPSKVAVLVIGK